VHVSASRAVKHSESVPWHQHLDVTIRSKKYELVEASDLSPIDKPPYSFRFADKPPEREFAAVNVFILLTVDKVSA
jgi:hypothetical protein